MNEQTTYPEDIKVVSKEDVSLREQKTHLVTIKGVELNFFERIWTRLINEKSTCKTVVDPGKLKVERGDSVKFKAVNINKKGAPPEDAIILIPYKKLLKNPEVIFELNANNNYTKSVMVENDAAKRTYKYAVYSRECEGLGEGNSPPKMIVK